MDLHTGITATARAGLLAFLLSTGIGMAAAGTAYGLQAYYGPVGGYSYWNQSYIVTATGTDSARVINSVDGSGNAPGGYMGVLARGYNANSGALVCSYGWQYSPGSTHSMNYLCTFTGSSSSSYYSRGQTKAWTGTSYNTYATFASPNQNG